MVAWKRNRQCSFCCYIASFRFAHFTHFSHQRRSTGRRQDIKEEGHEGGRTSRKNERRKLRHQGRRTGGRQDIKKELKEEVRTFRKKDRREAGHHGRRKRGS